jgi:DNA polymerase-3 subunit epsilon
MTPCHYILGIDLEGVHKNLIEDGIQLNTDRVTEIGAVLWDCQRCQPVWFMSELINEPDHLPIDEELQELTGIDDEMLNQWGHKDEQIKTTLKKLSNMMEESNYFMAHNAHGYDKPMLTELFKRFDVPMPDKTWIDSLEDIEFPKKMKTKSMAGLEHAHGFINPFPHRAVTDVLSMLKIASNYDFSRMAKLACSEKVLLVAKLDAPNWKDKEEVDEFNKIKHKVSKARFRWNPRKKQWWKEVHKLLLDEGKIQYDFPFIIKSD